MPECTVQCSVYQCMSYCLFAAIYAGLLDIHSSMQTISQHV